MKIRFVVLYCLINLCLAYAQNDCEVQYKDWYSAHYQCLSKLKESADTKKQPESGIFDVAYTEFIQCMNPVASEFPGFYGNGPCVDLIPQKEQKTMARIVKSCFDRTDMSVCDTLLKDKNVDDFRDSYDNTLLMIAVSKLDESAVDYFLGKNADVGKYNRNGENALHVALTFTFDKTTNYSLDLEKQIAVTKKLLNAGVDVNELNISLESPLYLAIKNDVDSSIINLLIEAGAKINVFISENGEILNKSALLLAIKENKLNYVSTLLWKRKIQKEESGLIWQAVFSGNNENQKLELDSIVPLLLKNGADPNFFDVKSAAGLAISNGCSVRTIEEFFKAGLNIKKTGGEGKSSRTIGDDVMMRALMNDNVDAAELLLKKKYDLSRTISYSSEGDEQSALEVAVLAKKEKFVQLFVKFKANVNKKLKFGDDGEMTPLCLAMFPEDNAGIVEILLKAGAKSNVFCRENASTSYSPLQRAVGELDERTVKNLIAAKADVNAKVGDGSIALLEYAEMQGNEDIVEMLKKAGAKKPFRGSFVEYCLNNPAMTEKMAQEAVALGADVNETDAKNGLTPLHVIASRGKNVGVLKFLIKKGAFVNGMTKKGATPFLLAAQNNPDPNFLKVLIAEGADVEVADSDGWRAFQWAVALNSPEVVSFLLRTTLAEGLSPADKNVIVRTAVRNKNTKTLSVLFKAGYSAAAGNGWNEKNPLHIAIEEKCDLDMIKMLLQNKAVVDETAMRLAKNLPIGDSESSKYRNGVIDLLTKAKKKKR